MTTKDKAPQIIKDNKKMNMTREIIDQPKEEKDEVEEVSRISTPFFNLDAKMKTPTPNDWIEEKMKEFETSFYPQDILITDFDNNLFNRDERMKDFLKSSLTQQKEAIEKDWREKIIDCCESLERSETIMGDKNEYAMSYNSALKDIKELLN